jgi:molybdopterin-biosynthesis enzyme MoeA-like protein
MSVVGRVRSGLGVVPDEPDQMVRLARFRRDHPEVVIGDGGFGTLQAIVPAPDGEQVITRYTLRELLDKLAELLG